MTRHEIGGMGTNMHRGEIWPRERLPVYVELFLSDQPLFKAMLEPTGIAGDGAAQIYQRFPVPSGWHSIRARLRDSARQEGFDFESQVDVELALGEKFVIDFRSELGGFLFGTHLLDGGRGREISEEAKKGQLSNNGAVLEGNTYSRPPQRVGTWI